MEIKSIDIEKIKLLSNGEKTKALTEYEEEKQALIEEYMRVQEIVDEYNEYIFNLSCKIEQINKAVQKIQDHE